MVDEGTYLLVTHTWCHGTCLQQFRRSTPAITPIFCCHTAFDESLIEPACCSSLKLVPLLLLLLCCCAGEQTWPTEEELSAAAAAAASRHMRKRRLPAGTSEYQAAWILDDDEDDDDDSDASLEGVSSGGGCMVRGWRQGGGMQERKQPQEGQGWSALLTSRCVCCRCRC